MGLPLVILYLFVFDAAYAVLKFLTPKQSLLDGLLQTGILISDAISMDSRGPFDIRTLPT